MNSYTLKATALSHIHVGTGEELRHGFDFALLDKEISKISLIDFNALSAINEKGLPDTLETLFINNKTAELNSYWKKLISQYPQLVLSELPYAKGVAPDIIKEHTKDAQGLLYIPGSSIKGAITSALLGYQSTDPTKDDNYVLGSFAQRITSKLRIPDLHFNILGKVYPTKVFNLRNERREWLGGWKHNNKLTTAQFNNNQFITYRRCITGKSTATGSCSIANALPDNLAKVKNLKDFAHDSIFDYCRAINAGAIKYLEKEIVFFNDYSTEETGSIIDTYNNIKEITDDFIESNTPENCSCLLRLGAGSGFHAMTGDRYSSHTTMVEKPVQVNGRPMQNKSRSLGFYAAKGEMIFFPYGWIELNFQKK